MNVLDVDETIRERKKGGRRTNLFVRENLHTWLLFFLSDRG